MASVLSRSLINGIRCQAFTKKIIPSAIVIQHLKCPINNPVSGYYTSVGLFKKKEIKISLSDGLETQDEEAKSILEDTEYNVLLTHGDTIVDLQSIAVLQPWVKGHNSRKNTSRELLLAEACALVKSLPLVSISYKEVVNDVGSGLIFGTGNLDRLKETLRQHSTKGIFISSNYLKRSQVSALEAMLGLKVFDRYSVVLEIFRYYSRSVESRLQIALAELPYARRRANLKYNKVNFDKRQARLKIALENIAKRRGLARKRRQESQLPSVAIVGYTNCGKTTLIRELTGDTNIVGEDRLFATLDVTCHGAHLPCGLFTTYVDTVGFIQDIPTNLIASFQATLQDAVYADVVVHLRDVSHPDLVAQTDAVFATLELMKLPEETPVILINNKCDLLKDPDAVPDTGTHAKAINVSAVTGEGLMEAAEAIEKELLRVTKRKKYRMRLPTGSPEISWLRKIANFSSENYDEKDPDYTFVQIVLSNKDLAEFKKTFFT